MKRLKGVVAMLLIAGCSGHEPESSTETSSNASASGWVVSDRTHEDGARNIIAATVLEDGEDPQTRSSLVAVSCMIGLRSHPKPLLNIALSPTNERAAQMFHKFASLERLEAEAYGVDGLFPVEYRVDEGPTKTVHMTTQNSALMATAGSSYFAELMQKNRPFEIMAMQQTANFLINDLLRGVGKTITFEITNSFGERFVQTATLKGASEAVLQALEPCGGIDWVRSL